MRVRSGSGASFPAVQPQIQRETQMRKEGSLDVTMDLAALLVT